MVTRRRSMSEKRKGGGGGKGEVHLRAVGLYGVVDVDEHQEDGDQEGHPTRDDLRVHQETAI